MRIFSLVVSVLLWSGHAYGQQKALAVVPEKAFRVLSDSILIDEDKNNQLAVIYDMAKDKKLVAIGEVTHGTEEVSVFQGLIARNLISRHQFKAVVLGEVSLLDAFKVNDYVVNGNITDLSIGGKEKISEVAYRHDAMLGLYDWVRKYNEGRPFKDKIWIIGADIDEPGETLKFVRNHCRNYGIESAESILNRLELNLKRIYKWNSVGINTIVENTDELVRILEKTKGYADSTDIKVSLMVRALRTLPQLFAFSVNTDMKYKMRDKFIYENIVWMTDSLKKDRLVIIKAHNFHVNRKTIYTEVFGKFQSFGEYLSQHYGQAYLSLGTEVQQGRFYTGSGKHAGIAQNKNKLGNLIGTQTGARYGILVSDSLSRSFMNRPENTITYGTVNYQSSLLINCKGIAGDAFDALIFIRNSTPYSLVRRKNK